MQIIKNLKGIDTIIYAETFEYEAYEQVKKLANFEAYVDSKIRIMPDSHAGKGCTVGTTMTITDKITPNLVGVDIGCGMTTIKLKDKEIDLVKLDNIINTKIPSGFNINTTTKAQFDFSKLVAKTKIDITRAALSIGSLGGGNHFLELNKSELDGSIYLVVHSGSRNFGNQIAKYYQDLAFQNSNEMVKVKNTLIQKLKKEGREKEIDKEIKKLQKPASDKELAYLVGDDFNDYMNDMEIAQEYAVLNRKTIADTIIKEMGFKEEMRFDTIHNYIDFKRMILRKGAVSSEKGEMLLIPINMRDGSLICIGKGNEEWNYSAPHGAGRLMSRSKAKENIDYNSYVDSMSGIYTTSVCKETLDEAPAAYKSIDEIKRTIVDTVEIIDTIKPIYNFKAH